MTKARATGTTGGAKGALVVGTGSTTAAALSVGTDGQFLTAASGQTTGLQWATPALGSMTLLSTTTLSGATTTISSISQSYTHLYAYIYGVTNATADGTFYLAPNGNTTISSNFQLFSNSYGWGYSATDYLRLSSSASNVKSAYNNANNSWSLTINNYSNTSSYKNVSCISNFYGANLAIQLAFALFGGIATNSAITSLVFSNSGGNLSTGTVLLYGVN